MKFTALLLFTSSLTWGLSQHAFEREVEKQAKYMGYVTEHPYYVAAFVGLNTLRMITDEPAFAASRWSNNPHEFQVWVLSDKGLDEFADFMKLPHLTHREKTEIQRKAIVHEFVHGWGIDDENIVIAMTGLIRGHGAYDGNSPKRWLVILQEREKQKAKVEERPQ